MKYTKQEVVQFVREEDVNFIRLAFCDVFGKQKNITIMPSELERAFEAGIAIDASAVSGFGGEIHSDMFLHPDPETLASLPWRPEFGKVVWMFCTVAYPDGRVFENDSRSILKDAVARAAKAGLSFYFGAEMEFYLFKLDENGNPIKTPYDHAGYMDISPYDKGENVCREICMTLKEMGISPECSHHEEGPGQNEIDFRYSDALSAADNALTFRKVVQDIALRNGLWASFSPKPFDEYPGNGFHINMSVQPEAQVPAVFDAMIAGVLKNARAMTVFLNQKEESYKRLGSHKAPRYISWSSENRSQLIRIPAARGAYKRMELRSPDPRANPYLAFALLIHAAMDGIEAGLTLPEPADINLYLADESTVSRFERLPATLAEAVQAARNSCFLRAHLPEMMIRAYCDR